MKYYRYYKKRILHIDMDGVVADWHAEFMKRAPHLWVDSEIRTPEEQEKIDEIERIPGFYRNLPLIEGAKEAVHELAEHFEIFFLSTASWDNPSSWTDKRLWIEDHFPEIGYKKLILTHHKDLVVGDYLVDDRKKNGAENFKGTHIHFRTTEFPDWDSVKKFLINF